MARTNEFIGIGAARPARPHGHRAPRPAGRGERHGRSRTTASSASSCTRCSRPCRSTTRGSTTSSPRSPRRACRSSRHVGAGEDEDANERGAPTRCAGSPTTLPDLKLIACHYGGYHRLDEAEEHVVGSRVTLETSWPPTMAELDPERLVAIIRRHGADRVVFGSDWPMADPAAEIAAIRDLGLTHRGERRDPRRQPRPAARASLSDRMSGQGGPARRGHGLLGRQRAARDRDGRARRHRLPVLRPPGRADHVDPRQAARRQPRSRLHARHHRPAARRPARVRGEGREGRHQRRRCEPPRGRGAGRRELAKELGLSGVRVAVVTGDDIEAESTT